MNVSEESQIEIFASLMLAKVKQILLKVASFTFNHNPLRAVDVSCWNTAMKFIRGETWLDENYWNILWMLELITL